MGVVREDEPPDNKESVRPPDTFVRLKKQL